MSRSVVLLDHLQDRKSLLPLVARRPIGNLRIGAFTLDQKWSTALHADISYLSEDYLSAKFPLTPQNRELFVVNSVFLPDNQLIESLKSLSLGEALVDAQGDFIAALCSFTSKEKLLEDLQAFKAKAISYAGPCQRVRNLEDIFLLNGRQIEFDAGYIAHVAGEYKDVTFIGERFKIEQGVSLSRCTLDSSSGTIVILKGAVIEDFSVIHGPAVIGRNSRVKAGSSLYANVTVGDGSVVAGELNNTVIWGDSAKGHYGYLGCAVLGEGCNLGAGSSNSNLKNDWSEVSLFSYLDNKFRNTELLKCGVFIGDFTMLGIGSKINTGTVLGLGSQIAVSNFIPKFVADFTWLTDSQSENYIFEKFISMLGRRAKLKNQVLSSLDIEILSYIYHNQTY